MPVQCKVTGETVNGTWGADSWWLRVSYQGQVGYVTDEWVNTKSHVDDDSLIPPC